MNDTRKAGRILCRSGGVVMLGALLAMAIAIGYAVRAGDDYAQSSRGIGAAFDGALIFLLGGGLYGFGRLLRD